MLMLASLVRTSQQECYVLISLCMARNIGHACALGIKMHIQNGRHALQGTEWDKIEECVYLWIKSTFTRGSIRFSMPAYYTDSLTINFGSLRFHLCGIAVTLPVLCRDFCWLCCDFVGCAVTLSVGAVTSFVPWDSHALADDIVQSTLSKADTVGTKATVRFRESSGYLIPEPPN